ncbi:MULTISPECIES: LuxR C-terminal-related transcriptional regulator [Vibrio]|uniref:LuxR C-terminal-related transcriptional regulator n=2 Tax=Vibrio jasicida TaxID=766224 RepID=A0ABW7JER6_9VIBR|nr:MULTISPECIES: LuxR C-terminal-related transcriptional regulator [Vibrio]KIP67925.1 transcriptional regulator [Vibrio harveyi]KIP76677.1 transcriptional regulator [Vibrio harveyi]MCF6450668.1 LuxR C-terminal-related transcriptional regulator [Vibrio sp. MMG023]MCX2789688.1 LuxR C-terminal-related transcriptional regulator [Vibrio sp. Sgm 5]NOJ16440.1 helix-turn-helix transcriptional regulator [Vibrio jasicida]
MRNIMEQYKERPEILMITQQSLQSENFKEMLSKNTETKITIIDSKNPSYHELIPEEYFLLVDFSVETPSDTLVYLKDNEKVLGTIMLNLGHELDTEELASWPHVKGIFGPSDSMAKLCQGLKAIIDGDNWLSRRLLEQLLTYYKGKESNYVIEPAIEVELTRREVQVLQMLKDGGSNMEIADSLFISEHTIKSHLYNIFRKIEVKNRTQATSWAKRNL